VGTKILSENGEKAILDTPWQEYGCTVSMPYDFMESPNEDN
jgi:hypothetical protein